MSPGPFGREDLNERTERTVSESKENKSLSRAEREEKRRKEERANHRSIALYTLVGVVVVVAALAMILWNTGIFQRTLTAVEVDGVKYTAADVDYYYNTAYNSIVNRYMNTYYMAPFDTSTSTKDQVYDAESGQTWYDYLMETAINNLKSDTALSAKAAAEGYTLSESAQESLDSTVKQMETGWITSGYTSRDSFIKVNFGSAVHLIGGSGLRVVERPAGVAVEAERQRFAAVGHQSERQPVNVGRLLYVGGAVAGKGEHLNARPYLVVYQERSVLARHEACRRAGAEAHNRARLNVAYPCLYHYPVGIGFGRAALAYAQRLCVFRLRFEHIFCERYWARRSTCGFHEERLHRGDTRPILLVRIVVRQQSFAVAEYG